MASDEALPGERGLDMSDESDADQPQENVFQDADQVVRLTLDYLDVLNGSHDVLPHLDDLSIVLRQRVLNAWSSVDRLLVDESLPPLESDPTAIALGAVPTTLLDPTAMRDARQARNLRPSDVASSLQQRGWSTTTADVFTWERRPEHVAPALLADIAAMLGVARDLLTGSESGPASVADDAMNTLVQTLYSDALNEVIEQWAQVLGLGPTAAREDLQRRLSSAAHRGARTLTTRQWKAVVLVLLASERARREQTNDPLTGA